MRYPQAVLTLTAQTFFSDTIAFTFNGHSIPYNAPSFIQPSLVKPSSSYSVGLSSPSSSSSVLVRRAVPDDDVEDVNPYNDPNYPDVSESCNTLFIYLMQYCRNLIVSLLVCSTLYFVMISLEKYALHG